MSDPHVIDGEQLGLLFPFYFVCDAELRVMRAGPSLARFFPQVEGARLSDLFVLKAPQRPFTYEGLSRATRRLVILAARERPLVLRGQLMPTHDGDRLAFYGAPWVGSSEALAETGLTLSDFGVHESVIEVLQLVQAQVTATRELRTAMAALGRQRGELHAANRELMVLKAIHEAMFEEPELGPAVRRILAAITAPFGYSASACLVPAGGGWRSVAAWNEEGAAPLAPRWATEISAQVAARETACDEIRVHTLAGEGAPRRLGSFAVAGSAAGLVAVVVLAGDEAQSRDGAPPVRTVSDKLLAMFESRITRRRLAAEEARYRGVVESVKEIIFQTDAGGKLTFLNPAWTTITGFAIADSLGKQLLGFAHHEDRARSGERFGVVASGAPTSTVPHETRTITRDGSYRWLEVLAQPLRDEGGVVVGVSGTMADIQARKERDLELTRAKEQAEAATRAKSELLATVSHEVRTPLNGILGMTEVALATALSAEQRGYLEVIRSSAAGLRTIVDDVLDFEKLAAHELRIEAAPFEPRRLLRDLLRPIAMEAAAKGLELLVAVAPEVPDLLVGDAVRIGQIVSNLVGNAVKYTHVGEINVALALVRHDGDAVTLELEVRDTGVGMPAGEQTWLSGELSNWSARRRVGTALGLAISSRLATLMGGKLSLDARARAGCTFRAVLQVRSAPRVARPPQPLEGISAVVLERHPRARALIARMLRRVGAAPVEVAHPAEARAELETLRAAKLPAVALVDERFDLADRAAIADAAAGGLIVLAYPGVGAVLERAVARHPRLLRPVFEDELVEKVLAAVAPAAPRGGATAGEHHHEHAAPAAGGGLRILVVDDNAVNRAVARAMLERRGHDVIELGDGRTALDALDEIRVDLVLLDVDMPDPDGIATVRELRRREGERGRARVPVVALTAARAAGDRARCLAAGMDDYVATPCTADVLLGVVARCAGPKRSIDLPALLERFGGDAGLVQELARLYATESTACEARLREAMLRGDVPTLQALSSRMEGALLNMAAVEAAAAARALERSTREGDPQRVGSAFASLVSQLRVVEGDLRHLLA